MKESADQLTMLGTKEERERAFAILRAELNTFMNAVIRVDTAVLSAGHCVLVPRNVDETARKNAMSRKSLQAEVLSNLMLFLSLRAAGGKDSACPWKALIPARRWAKAAWQMGTKLLEKSETHWAIVALNWGWEGVATVLAHECERRGKRSCARPIF